MELYWVYWFEYDLKDKQFKNYNKIQNGYFYLNIFGQFFNNYEFILFKSPPFFLKVDLKEI